MWVQIDLFSAGVQKNTINWISKALYLYHFKNWTSHTALIWRFTFIQQSNSWLTFIFSNNSAMSQQKHVTVFWKRKREILFSLLAFRVLSVCICSRSFWKWSQNRIIHEKGSSTTVFSRCLKYAPSAPPRTETNWFTCLWEAAETLLQDDEYELCSVVAEDRKINK